MALSQSDLEKYISGPARRKNFFRYLTSEFCPESAVFLLLVDQYEHNPSKAKAVFIGRHFCECEVGTDAHSAEMKDNCFGVSINVPGNDKTKAIKAEVVKLHKNKTLAGKVLDQGLFKTIKNKITNDYRADPGLFDDLVKYVRETLDANHQLFKQYNPDAPPPMITALFESDLPAFSRVLTLAGFNPEQAGIC